MSGDNEDQAPFFEFDPLKPYTFAIEKKASIRWNVRYFTLKGLELSYKESADPHATNAGTGDVRASMMLQSVTRTAEKSGIDLLGLVVEGVAPAPNGGTATTIKWQLRAKDVPSLSHVYELLQACLVHWGRMESVNMGLPPEDPRMGLPFVDVPLEHLSRFSLLGRAVMYFFDDVTEYYLNPSSSSSSSTISSIQHENRVCVLSDKFMYLCTPYSDIARCIRLTDIDTVYYAPPRVGVRTTRIENVKDYDLLLETKSGERARDLVQAMCVVYSYITQGAQLPVVEDVAPSELGKDRAALDIVRPIGWVLRMALPTSKKNLSRALEVFKDKQLTNTLSALENLTPEQRHEHHDQIQSLTQAVEYQLQLDAAMAVPQNLPLGKLMCLLRLPHYYHHLMEHEVDWDVLKIVEKEDLEGFGVASQDADVIMKALSDPKLLDAVTRECEAANAGTPSSSTTEKKHDKDASPNSSTATEQQAKDALLREREAAFKERRARHRAVTVAVRERPPPPPSQQSPPPPPKREADTTKNSKADVDDLLGLGGGETSSRHRANTAATAPAAKKQINLSLLGDSDDDDDVFSKLKQKKAEHDTNVQQQQQQRHVVLDDDEDDIFAALKERRTTTNPSPVATSTASVSPVPTPKKSKVSLDFESDDDDDLLGLGSLKGRLSSGPAAATATGDKPPPPPPTSKPKLEDFDL
eukprot:PhM_4_TR14729/c0_g1_i1/m.12380